MAEYVLPIEVTNMIDDKFKIRYKFVPVAVSESIGSNPTRLHNHDEFEILLINSGSSSVYIANKEYKVSTGDMVFINPMEIHEVIPDNATTYAHQCICCDLSIVMHGQSCGNISNECSGIVPIVKGSTLHGIQLSELFKKVFDAFKRDEKTAAMEVCAYITLLFSYLLKNSLVDAHRTNNKETEFCSNVIDYIKKHYMENITSKQAADACFLNHSYFCRKFKENFGVKFSSYLNIHRISEARKRFEENVETITDISVRCGFETPAYFSRCFKEFVGVSPQEYKKGKRSL